MARLFSPIPAVVGSNIDPALMLVLSPMKENLEVLLGQRGGLAANGTALLRGDVTVEPLASSFTAVSATGAGFTVEGIPLASAADYQRAVSDLRLIQRDLENIIGVVNALIAQLRRR